MDIIYKTGDILFSEEKVIVHGVNCQGVMGSGVAKSIRDKYPSAYQDYKLHCAMTQPIQCLGDIIISVTSDCRYIIHAFTQLNFGRDKNKVYVNYEALKNCFIEITNEVEDSGYCGRIAMPKIGAGLANGDWNIISNIIVNVSGGIWQPVVYEY